jgi:hypothetical protein
VASATETLFCLERDMEAISIKFVAA